MTNAKRKYKKNIYKLQVDFFPTDAELIEWLNDNRPIATTIKNLIREEIKKTK